MPRITLPAGAMGPNGVLRITTLWSYTNSANNKTLRVRLGGLSGTAFQANVVTASNIGVMQRTIQNRNSQASQIGFNAANAASYTTVGQRHVSRDGFGRYLGATGHRDHRTARQRRRDGDAGEHILWSWLTAPEASTRRRA